MVVLALVQEENYKSVVFVEDGRKEIYKNLNKEHCFLHPLMAKEKNKNTSVTSFTTGIFQRYAINQVGRKMWGKRVAQNVKRRAQLSIN